MRRIFNNLFDILDTTGMESEKKIRLGHVEGEIAARLRETLNVTGMSLEEFTRRAVESYLSQKTAQDKARHEANNMVRIVSDKTVPFKHVEGLGMCLICADGPVTLEEFADMIRTRMKEG